MKIIFICLCFVWVGLLLGISFIEAPLKFKAPGITTNLGLGIGKLVFTALNRIELVIAFVMLILGLMLRHNILLYFSIPIIILLIQTFFLLPELNNRVDSILSGQTIAPSKHHIVFIVLEILKLLSLLIMGCLYLSKIIK